MNAELQKTYKKIFDCVDKFIFLKVPSFKRVYEWRLLQEKKLRLSSKGKKIMKNYEVKNFVMFYERLTKHMLKNFSLKADTVITIDNKHKQNNEILLNEENFIFNISNFLFLKFTSKWKFYFFRKSYQK